MLAHGHKYIILYTHLYRKGCILLFLTHRRTVCHFIRKKKNQSTRELHPFPEHIHTDAWLNSHSFGFPWMALYHQFAKRSTLGCGAMPNRSSFWRIIAHSSRVKKCLLCYLNDFPWWRTKHSNLDMLTLRQPLLESPRDNCLQIWYSTFI
jgi:hypothetical protein